MIARTCFGDYQGRPPMPLYRLGLYVDFVARYRYNDRIIRYHIISYQNHKISSVHSQVFCAFHLFIHPQ